MSLLFKLKFQIFWERNGALISLLAFVGILFLIVNMCSIEQVSRRIDGQNKLDGRTSGTVISIEPVSTITQDFNGAKEVIISNRLKYSYSTRGRTYEGLDYIEDLSLIAYDDRGKLLIRFDLSSPENSLLTIKDE